MWGQLRAQSTKEKLHQLLAERDREDFSEDHGEGEESERETQLH